ncbi:MAG: hypothetical protein AUH85_09675 [Chloroflexi bacterium 13_1_40CM_4_68_4]|nr:MAG: hypothetical protein AUH85_09675 [Chloroflexi bacterium 13_1_40CM_4_68_4]
MRRSLFAAIFFVVACGVPGAIPPSSPVPSVSPAPSPSSSPDGRSLSLAAMQRVSATAGFVSGWTGTGLGLARTLDGGATWKKLTIPVSHLSELRFIDANVGWAIGFADRGQQVGCLQASSAPPCRSVVLRTDDGGLTWREVLSVPVGQGGGEMIHSLQAIDAAYAWVVVGDQSCPAFCGSELRGTTDGGTTWRTLYQGRVGPVRLASPRYGWIAAYGPSGIDYGADGGNVLVTSNGGATWSATLRGQPIIALEATDLQLVWALARDGAYCTASNCEKYELFRSDDAGATWKSLGNPKNQVASACGGGQLAGPLFASAARGWMGLNLGAGGAEGTGGLLSSDDGGATWRCAKVPANVALLSAADPDHVWVEGDDRTGSGASQIQSSDDGGRTWRALDLGSLR